MPLCSQAYGRVELHGVALRTPATLPAQQPHFACRIRSYYYHRTRAHDGNRPKLISQIESNQFTSYKESHCGSHNADASF